MIILLCLIVHYTFSATLDSVDNTLIWLIYFRSLGQGTYAIFQRLGNYYETQTAEAYVKAYDGGLNA